MNLKIKSLNPKSESLHRSKIESLSPKIESSNPTIGKRSLCLTIAFRLANHLADVHEDSMIQSYDSILEFHDSLLGLRDSISGFIDSIFGFSDSL